MGSAQDRGPTMELTESNPAHTLERFLDALPPDQAPSFADRRRWQAVWQLVHSMLPGPRAALVLGPPSPISTLLRRLGGLQVETLEVDPRQPLAVGGASADIILCLGIIEHLNDPAGPDAGNSSATQFCGIGAQRLLQDVRRALRPDGRLVLTTPNAASVDVVAHAIMRRSPMHDPRHVREYTPDEVLELAAAAGFTCETWVTFFTENPHPDLDRAVLMAALARQGFDMSERGDQALFVFRPKP